MKSRIVGTVASVALLAALAASAAELPADTVRYLDQTIAGGQLVGVVVAYVDGSDTAIRAFGVASKETGKPPDAGTMFEIGSITKTFTAALLAEEVLGGKVKLVDPVQKYLPEGVTLAQVGERPIELGDIATQRSGLPRMPGNFTRQPALPIYADKPDHFFYVDAQLDFERDGAGKVTAVTLHQNGRDMRAPRADSH
jgi:CubicO group peptidase (beta-lactamase class C family)